MAGRPTKNSSRLRQSESSLHAAATRSGSREFHASSAAWTLARAVSSVKGGRMSVGFLIVDLRPSAGGAEGVGVDALVLDVDDLGVEQDHLLLSDPLR